jgi:hypothetical protein
MTVDRELRSIVNGIYDLQQLRISIGNRIVASFRAKLGIKPSEDKKKRGKEADKLLKAIRQEYSRITDGIVKITMRLKVPKGSKLIHSTSEIMLIKQYENVLSCEKIVFKDMAEVVKTRPLWQIFFEPIKGCGAVVAGFIMAYINIEEAETVSKLWYYCGYGVEPDGKATSRRKEHLYDIPYIDKEGNPKTKKGIKHNPVVKSKLAFVLSRGLLTTKDYYKTEIYDPYKHRIKSDPKHADKKPKHIDNMAKRKMVKAFLQDLYPVWRGIEGLPVAKPFAEAKLGIKHGDHATTAPMKK